MIWTGHWDWLRSRRGLLPALTCPVFRAGVMAPDARDVEVDLPEERVQRSALHPAGCLPLGGALAAQPCAAAGAAVLEGAGRRAADSAPAAAGVGAAGPAR